MDSLNERKTPLGNEEEKEIDIASVFRVILSKWYWILSCALVLAVALYCVANFGIAPKYQSAVSLYVVNTTINSRRNLSIQAICRHQKVLLRPIP